MRVIWIALILSPTLYGAPHEARVSVKELKSEKRQGLGKPAKKQSNIRSVFSTTGVKSSLIREIDKTLKFLKQTQAEVGARSDARRRVLEKMLNLTSEQASYVSGSEHEAFQRAWDSWSARGEKGQEPKYSTGKSNRLWTEVEKIGVELLKLFPKNRNNDKIYFQTALAEQMLAKEDIAAITFKKMVQNHPKSPLAGDAYFSIGEYYFNANNFQEGLKWYLKVLRYKNTRSYGWALFKAGWCSYNVGKYKDSLKHWKRAVLVARRSGAKQLKEEVLGDMIFAFAELKDINGSLRFYRKHGESKHIAKTLFVLANTFADQGKNSSALSTYRKLAKLTPDQIEVLTGQLEIGLIYFKQRKYSRLWGQIEATVKKYGPGSRFASKNDSERIKDAMEKLQEQSLYFAKKIHSLAQKQKSNKLFHAAEDGYKVYLKVFKKNDDLEIKEYLADISFRLGEYKQAGEVYLSIVRMGQEKANIVVDGKRISIHRRSATNMLDAYGKAFDPEFIKLKKLKPDFAKKPKMISSAGKGFIAACETYLKAYPSDRKIKEKCDLFLGEIYFRLGDKVQAQKHLWYLATNYSKSKVGIVAVENLIPIVSTYDQAQVAQTVTKLLGIPAYRAGKLGKKLRDLQRGIEIEAITKEADISKRAYRYEQRALSHKNDPEAYKFLYNAGTDYVKSEKWRDAIRVYGMIVQKYPKSSVAEESYLELAKLTESKLKDPDKAGEYFYGFARRYPRSKAYAGSLQKACELSLLYNLQSATKRCMELISKFPKESQFYLERLIDIAWYQNNSRAMNDLILNKYFKLYRLNNEQQAFSYYKIASLSGPGRQRNLAYSKLKAMSSNGQASGKALRFGAGLLFKSQQGALNRFKSLKLKGGSVDNLQSSLQKMFQGTMALEQAYAPVLKTKDAYWGIAVFYLLGKSYERFAKELKDPPAIPGVQKEDVVNQLQETINQVASKSQEYYQLGLKTTKEFKIYNDYATLLFNKEREEKANQSFMIDAVALGDYYSFKLPSEFSKWLIR